MVNYLKSYTAIIRRRFSRILYAESAFKKHQPVMTGAEKCIPSLLTISCIDNKLMIISDSRQHEQHNSNY